MVITQFHKAVAGRTLAMEARGEPSEGQNAVAWVLRNRLESGRWGHSLASVCLWHAQFSGWWCPRGKPSFYDPNFAYACDLLDTDPVLLKMISIVDAVMASAPTGDFTNGALYYYALSLKDDPPEWASSMVSCGQYGHQLFLKPQEAPSV